jgi:heptosyltransferase-2
VILKSRPRILVMRYRFIGDTLLTVPFLRQLRATYPDSQIDLLAAPQSGELLQHCPYLNRVLMFDTTRKHRYENSQLALAPRSFWSYVRQLRQEKYSTAFVLKRSFSSAALAFLAGIPERVGFDTEGRGWLLTKRVAYQQQRHEIDSFLDVLAAADISTNARDRRLESWESPAETYKARSYLAEIAFAESSRPYPPRQQRHIVLHLTSSNANKEWPLEEAVKLATWLLEHGAYHLHALGALSDAPVYEALRTQLPEAGQERLHNHCGQFTLTGSMAFLKLMDLVVGVDSGTLHMAAAAKLPVLALFGPMDPRKWSPLGAEVISSLSQGCSACKSSYPCPQHTNFLQDLRAETVIETIRRMITLLPEKEPGISS